MGEIKSKIEWCTSELENQIKSNRSLIYITTHEEHRVDDAIQHIACQRAKPWSFIFWDIAGGGYTNSSSFKIPENIDQSDILSWFKELIIEKDDFCILVLHDFYKFLAPNSEPGQVEILTIRALRNLVEICNTQRKCVILTGAKYFVPTEFEKLVCLLDWPLPEENTIHEIVSHALIETSKKTQFKSFKVKYTESELNQIIQSFRGLTLREIEMILTYFILTEPELDHQKIASKKKDIIKKSGILEWVDLELNLSEVGGLPNLKDWLLKRKDAFSDSAKKYGLPEPKGLLITGIQGGGKSRVAKAIASYWGIPLLRLDVGRIFSSLVGSSEENLRFIIKLAESIAPCVLWADELEKGFSGSTISSDSGTSSRVFGTFLTWLQEKKSPVIVVATANDISNLPPELVRKGRFDEIFFVDLPDKDERKEIWTIHINQRNLTQDFDLELLIKESEGFTGAEIEASIVAAMYEGFSDNKRQINTVDILKELKQSIPISITMKERIDSLRTWAAQRARNASRSKDFIVPKNILEKNVVKRNDSEEEL